MKSIHIFATLIVLVTFLAVISGCQQPQKAQIEPKPSKITEAAPPEQTGTSKIEVTKAVCDLTEIGPSTKHTCKYEFKNVGDGTLIIKKVQSTCSCTIGKLSKLEYAPGESGSVKVTYTASSAPGVVKKHLYILSNDTENSKAELLIKAKIVLKVAAEPKKMDLLLKEENAAAKPIILKSKDGREFSIKSITTSNNIITADFDPQVKATEFTLQPKVDIKKLKKTLNGSIRISLTHPECKQINIRFTAKPLFELSRPRIIIQNAEPGKSVTKDILVKSNYGDDFQIESSSSQKGYMQITKQEKVGNGYRLTVEVTPPPKSSNTKRYITDKLNIKIKDSETLTVSCSGWYAVKR